MPRTPFCFCLKSPRAKGDPFTQFEEYISNSFCSWQLVQKDCSIQPPHCTQLGSANDDCGTQADYVVVEMARHLLGENWMADYVQKANNGGIERVLL